MKWTMLKRPGHSGQTLRVHYSCCQAVLVTFADRLGLTPEQANALGGHFGSGMRHGSTCGAVSGALMVLGLLGCDEKQSTALLRDFRTRHGALDCADLLRASRNGESCARTTATAWSWRCLDFWRNCSGSRAPDPDRGVGGDCQVPAHSSVSSTSVSSCSPVSSSISRPAGDLSLSSSHVIYQKTYSIPGGLAGYPQ